MQSTHEGISGERSAGAGLEAGLVPPAVRAALAANGQLRQALQESGLPRRFQAMVLGLATLRQMRSHRGR